MTALPDIADMGAERVNGLFVVSLPFPAKVLWPNGRTRNHKWKAAEFKKHKRWAHDATLFAIPHAYRTILGPITLRYIVAPKTRNRIDRDNAIAAMKAYQDGIALALAVDDGCFASPQVEFAEPRKFGGVEVVIA